MTRKDKKKNRAAKDKAKKPETPKLSSKAKPPQPRSRKGKSKKRRKRGPTEPPLATATPAPAPALDAEVLPHVGLGDVYDLTADGDDFEALSGAVVILFDKAREALEPVLHGSSCPADKESSSLDIPIGCCFFH